MRTLTIWALSSGVRVSGFALTPYKNWPRTVSVTSLTAGWESPNCWDKKGSRDYGTEHFEEAVGHLCQIGKDIKGGRRQQGVQLKIDLLGTLDTNF